MATGGGSAYARLEKPDNAISQSFQYWGGLKAQEREADKGRAERAQIRREEQAKEWDKEYGFNYDDFISKVTGFDTYDQIKADYASQVSDQYVDLYRKANEAMASGNIQDRRKYESQMMRLKGAFKQVQQADELIGKRFSESMKMAQEGKMSGVDSDTWDAEMQAIAKDMNYQIVVGSNGSPEVVGLKTLQDGSQEPFRIKFSDIVNGTWRPYQKQQVAGKGGLIDNVLLNLGKKTYDTRTGVLITTNQQWDKERELATRGHVESLLASDEVMADLYHQMVDSTSRKRTNFTDDEKKVVSDRLYDLVRGGYSEESKTTVDTREQALAETRRHNIAQEGIAREGLKNRLAEAQGKSLSKVEQVDLANRSKSVIAYGLTKRIGELQEKNPNITDRQLLEDPEIKKMRDVLGIDLGDTTGHWFTKRKNNIKIGKDVFNIKDKSKIAQAVADELGFIYDGRVVEDDFKEIGGYDGLYDKDMINIIRGTGKTTTRESSSSSSSGSYSHDDLLDKYGI